MPSRADMDRPAMVTAAILGFVLILVTIPYFAFGGGGGGSATYDITWSQASAGAATAPVGSGSEQSISVVVRDQRVSNATIEVAACADSAQAPLQEDAVLSYTLLYENETANDASGQAIEGQITVDDCGPFTFALGGHPDVGSTDADSMDQAMENAYGDSGNRTGTYTLRFSWDRPDGQVPPLPVPVGQPVFSGTVELEIQSWRATANEQGQEVPR